jgi:hypothetical protein
MELKKQILFSLIGAAFLFAPSAHAADKETEADCSRDLLLAYFP